MKRLFMCLSMLAFLPYLARADTPAMPDVQNWLMTSKSNIEVRISDTTVAFLGFDLEFQNPDNRREYVRVIKRHIPLILVKKRPSGGRRLFSEAAASFYAGLEEKDLLLKLFKESDPIAIVRWRTKEDPRTGRDLKDGDTEVWFLRTGGQWFFATNKRVCVEFISESAENGERRNILVGRKYSVDDYVYQILKLDRNDLRILDAGRQ